MTPSRRVEALLKKVASGDRRAFEELYRLSSPKLYGMALRILRRPQLAKSAVRTAFGRIFREAGHYRSDDDAVGWLVTMVRTCALDLARETNAVDAWEPFEVDSPAADPLAAGGHSPELRRLLNCLGALSEERRRVLLLAYYDGWSEDALSLYFDVPITGVKAWIARSASEIQACLKR